MVLFFIGAGVKVVIFDIGFLENYLYFKKGRIKDRIILFFINILMFLYLLIEKNVLYIYEIFFLKIYL